MAKIEIIISTEDGTVLQAFDVSDPNMEDATDIRLADEVRNVLSHYYEVEDK